MKWLRRRKRRRRVIADVREVALDPSLGSTPEEVIANLTAETLTGSAVALDDAWLETTDGEFVRYGEVWELRPPRT